MLDEMFYYFVRLYLPALILGIAGGFLILSYLKLKKKTNLIMSVGFLYLALGTVIVYFINESIYNEFMYTYSFLGIRELSLYAWLSLFLHYLTYGASIAYFAGNNSLLQRFNTKIA